MVKNSFDNSDALSAIKNSFYNNAGIFLSRRSYLGVFLSASTVWRPAKLGAVRIQRHVKLANLKHRSGSLCRNEGGGRLAEMVSYASAR